MHDRMANGVKERADGQGDAWARVHRPCLTNRHYMNDFDGFMGVFEQNSANRMFLEYVPDHWDNRKNLIREFGYIAFFDRKATRLAMHESTVSLAQQLHMCRKLSAGQAEPVRFFYVIGGDAPPWTLMERCIVTGSILGEYELDEPDWKPVWEELGLSPMRNRLETWLKKPIPPIPKRPLPPVPQPKPRN